MCVKGTDFAMHWYLCKDCIVMAMYWPENAKASQKMYRDTIVLKSVIVSEKRWDVLKKPSGPFGCRLVGFKMVQVYKQSPTYIYIRIRISNVEGCRDDSAKIG